jgi:hypothetical protein
MTQLPNFAAGPDMQDTRIMAKSLTQRWPMSDEMRQAVINRLVRVTIDPDSSPREVTSAARALMVAEAQNQQDQLHEDNLANERDRLLLVAAELGIETTVTVDAGSGTPRLDVSPVESVGRQAEG